MRAPTKASPKGQDLSPAMQPTRLAGRSQLHRSSALARAAATLALVAQALGADPSSAAPAEAHPAHREPSAVATSSPAASPSGLEHLATISLLDVLQRPIERNVLKLFRAAADPVRNRVYVSGIMTPDIAILDGATEQWIGTLESGIAGIAHKYLYTDPASRMLYVHDGSNGTLRAISLETGTTGASVAAPRQIGDLMIDAARGLIYVVAAQAPSFRALDARTLATVYESEALGPGASRLALSADGLSLYVLDGMARGPAGRLLRFDPDARRVVETIELALPSGERPGELDYDPTTSRLFVATSSEVRAFGTDGRLLGGFGLVPGMDLQDVVYDGANDRVLTLLVARPSDGQVAGLGGRLVAYDATTGQPTADLRFGAKPHSLCPNPATGRVYVPNGDTSVVWSISPSADSFHPLRLGDSIEQLVLDPSGDRLFMNSRLGGSYLLSYDIAAGHIEPFTAGLWPIPMRALGTQQGLLVLNAWDSTISLFDTSATPAPAELGVASLGLPRGSTDRLPDLAVDARRSLAFAAYPELGKVAIVDIDALVPMDAITLESFPVGDSPGGGPGQLQVIAAEEPGRLHVYSPLTRRLSTYDVRNVASGVPRVGDREVAPVAPDGQLGILFLDAALGRLFVGDLELDAATGAPTGRTLASGQRLFALDESRSAYWASAVESGAEETTDAVYVLDRGSLALIATFPLDAISGTTPEHALDPERGRLYVSHMEAAALDVYAVH